MHYFKVMEGEEPTHKS